jgi:hypothetical protein
MLAAFALSGGSAAASQDVENFAVSPSSSQAGGHPDIAVSLSLDAGSSEAADTVELGWPAGVNFLPSSVTRCLATDFAAEECPPSSQVGLVTIRGEHEGDPDHLLGTAAVHSLVAGAGEFGRLGFVVPVLDLPVTGALKLRSGSDHGTRMTFDGFPQTESLQALDLTIWGFPAAAEHDPERFKKGSSGCPEAADTACLTPPFVQSAVPVRPFSLNPTRCGAVGPLGLAVRTHEDPAHLSTDTAAYPSITGCEQISFDPAATASVGSTWASTPAGIDLRITTPQVLGSMVPSSAQLKDATLSFLGGLTIDEAALEETTVCGPAQAGIGSEAAPACPAASQLGTVAFESPSMIGERLTGGLHYGGPDPEGGYRLYLTGSYNGVHLKLQAILAVDAEDEDVAFFEFANLPQIPLEEIELHFFASPSSPLVTARRCGLYVIEALMAAWSAVHAEQASTSTHAIDAGRNGGPCPTPASLVVVSLDPSALPADGSSVTVATATVTEGNGDPVPDEDIRFASTDPGQRIGQVIDNEDGTYSARIVASTTPGPATITATDLSVAPAPRGSATLQQNALARASTAAPATQITKHPPRRTRKRRAVFAFRASIAGSSFACRLDRRRYRPCSSPTVFIGLKRGPHRFSVRATSPGGVAGDPAIYRFTVEKQSRKRRSRR